MFIIGNKQVRNSKIENRMILCEQFPCFTCLSIMYKTILCQTIQESYFNK